MQNKWKWLIGGLSGAAVVVVIVVPCVLLIPGDEEVNPTEDPQETTIDPSTKPTYTFDDLFGDKYGYNSLYPNWDKTDTTNNKQFIAYDSDKIVIRNIEKHNDNVKTLINDEGDGKTISYSVSADNMFVYYRDDYKKVWRHSHTGNYAIYKIVDGNEAGTRVNVPGFPSDGMIHHMEWSPTAHTLAYVHRWNVYVIKDLDTTPVITQVTSDGSQNDVYNGIPDWVYEEEMIGSNNVLYWAPDSSSFAYLKTDDTNTERVKFSMYGDAQYPETITIAYPKAGTTNPTVKMFVYDIAAATNVELPPAPFPTDKQGNFTDYYFSRFTWLDNNNCLITWVDRPQTHSIGNKCTKTTGWSCGDGVGTHEEVSNGWVGSFGPFDIVWKTGTVPNQYFTIYARVDDNDAEDGRWQIARVSADLSAKQWVTKTGYDIVGLYFYDETNDWLYFTAAAPEPRKRHIFRIKGSENNGEPECMTCQLEKDYENRCGWITPSFNRDRSIAVANCRGFWIPMTVYYTIDTEGNWQEKPTVIEDNAELATKVSATRWPQKEYGEFKSDKYEEKAYKYELFKPEDFDPNKKYPLLIEVYAGPEFQSVNDIWTSGWSSTHMVSDKDIVVASVDGRGSAYEGYKFMRQVYKKLGQMEPEDQRDFAQWLISQNDWIDPANVAIWGWSYGGYATSHTLGLDGGNTFKCGIAVAPLADWRFYDSMYAERYMGLPTGADNDAGYTLASIITGHDLENFKSTSYVLIHGTADDNVHFQNAAEMEKALVEKDVDFDDFFYADQAHSINTGNGSKHIYRQLTIRMAQCLGRSNTVYPGLPEA
uniref:prolyl endopeptidase FAP-like isoform X1 n=1 Tax=Styela clava TaxID=7725 RepID=UPI00193ACF6A|nr:prolyl endopeptidase FAP-like isoform X1 [Styela clava]